MRISIFLLVFVSVIASCADQPSDADKTAPTGLASLYPGDVGLNKDPDVLFFWDYENPSDWRSGWEGQLPLYSQTTDPAHVCFGSGAVEAKLVAGSHGNGDLMRLKGDCDCLYQRYYAKFPVGFTMGENGFKLHGFAGVAPNLPNWYPQGKAGIVPTGADKLYAIMCIGVGNIPAFYYYHPRQKGPWGDGARFENPHTLGTWRCYEFMLKINDVGQSNGELKCWVDGMLTGQVDGLAWRTVDSLKLNLLLDHVYNDVTQNQSVYFDNRVVARKYIGPLKPAASSPVKPASKERAPAAAPAVVSAADAIDPKPHRDAIISALLDPKVKKGETIEMTLLGKKQEVVVDDMTKSVLRVGFDGNMIPLKWPDVSDADVITLALACCPSDPQTVYEAAVLAAATNADPQVQRQIADLLWSLDSTKGKELKELLRP